MGYLRIKRERFEKKKGTPETSFEKTKTFVGSQTKVRSFVVRNPGSFSLSDGTKIKLVPSDVGKTVEVQTDEEGNESFNIFR